jgi:hypothetical protein
MPSIIRPTDYARFESKTRTLGAWNPATLKRLVPLLKGVRVIVVTDTRTGHAVEGYITGIRQSTLNSQYEHIAMADQPGAREQRLHRVSDMGEIMLLDSSNARWTLDSLLSQETGAALKAVRQHIGTDFPAGAPYKGERRWITTVTWEGVRVAWGESFRDRRWLVTDGTVHDYA